MRSVVLLVISASFLLLAGGCQPFLPDAASPVDTLKISTVGSIDAIPRGNISGTVALYDEFGVALPDNAGMVVSLEGLQTAFPATTRADGRFVISNAFAGTYNLSYNKPGYGNFKRIGISHAGGSVPTVADAVILWKTSQTVASELAVQISGLSMTFAGQTAPVQPAGSAPDQQRRVRLFFGRDQNVSRLTYVSSLGPFRVPPGGTGGFALKLSADDLLAFRPGERVYAVAHGITAAENAYTDPDTKLVVYSGTHPTPSNVVSFVLP